MAGETSYAQLPIALKGGLDLTTPRMLVEPGRLVHCLNYECVDTDGYKKIDGFERYDGGPTPSVMGYWNIRTTTNSGLGVSVAPGDTCRITYVDSLGATRVTTHICRDIYAESGKWAIEFYPTRPTSLATATSASIYSVTGGGTETAGTSSGVIITSVLPSLTAAVASSDNIRAEVDALPDSTFPYALQLYKNRMHVVADCRAIYLAFDTSSGASLDCTFYVGNLIRIGAAGTFQGIIKDWKFLRGQFSQPGTTAGNRAWIKVLVHPTTPDGDLVTGTAAQIDRAGTAFATPLTCWKYYSSIDGNGPTDSTNIWGGVLYKSLEEDVGVRDDLTNAWTQIDMGYEVQFNNGESTIEPRELTLATTTEELNSELQTDVGSPNTGSTYVGITNAYSNSGASFLDAGGNLTTDDEDKASYAYNLETSDATGIFATCTETGWGSDGIFISGLGLAVPDDAIITGISVDVKCRIASSTALNPTWFNDVRLKSNGVTGANLYNSSSAYQIGGSETVVTVPTYGGPNNTWGLPNLTPDNVNDPSFGLYLTPAFTTGGVGLVAYMLFDVLKVTVHYFRPVGKLYFYDGTDEVEAKLVRIHVNKGSWTDAANKAEGVAHIYDITPVGAATRNYIKPGDDLRLTSGGAKIADVVSTSGSFLPSHADLIASDRRFEIIRANYYLNPDWETIYGVHGLGRAFSYDNTYFRKIYTDYNATLDKPTHIASYRNYLALGFSSGNVLLSAISGDKGPLPEEFGATKGAREFSFIDHIHGLKELADTSLGVFCKSSINRLVLNTTAATADSIFYTAVISPNSGCIEYTVAGFGDSTLYCDQYGVRTVEQTDVYGDLIAKPLSYQVSPWLRPRFSSKKYWNNNRDANKPLFAHTIKAKNQYRVWFDDGYVLCMNLNTKDSPPQFTLLRYGFNFGGSFVPLTPIAFCQDTDDSVTERLHVAHWNRLSTSSGAENSSTLFKYVFELERGWSFDGQDFPCRLTVNLSLLDSPYDFDSIRKAELHGLDYNNTTLFCGWGTKYSEELSYSGLTMGDTFTPAARNVEASISDDYVPFCKVIQSGNRGRPLLMKLKNSTTATGTEATSVIEPPHILQAVLLQYLPLKTQG